MRVDIGFECRGAGAGGAPHRPGRDAAAGSAGAGESQAAEPDPGGRLDGAEWEGGWSAGTVGMGRAAGDVLRSGEDQRGEPCDWREVEQIVYLGLGNGMVANAYLAVTGSAAATPAAQQPA